MRHDHLPLGGLGVRLVRTGQEERRDQAAADQDAGITTFIEVVLNQELGEPFRRDAMKKPVAVAGIDRADMQPQTPR